MILVNGERFNDKEFHNGEVIFEKPELIVKQVVEGREEECYNEIKMVFEDNKDITALAFAKEYLDDVTDGVPCILNMMYCPYERMDREINQQMFSMKYFAKIIARMNFSRVVILDPHSNVCIDQLTKAGVKVEVLDIKKYINRVIEDFKPDYICYPDKGAKAKYTQVLADISIPCFYGTKTRDLANQGRIINYELVDAPDLTRKRVLIIDDICCLGGTAYNAAYRMKEMGAKEVGFYISHCENGIFAGKLLSREPFYPDGAGINVAWAGDYTINKVYTTTSMKLNGEHKNLMILD